MTNITPALITQFSSLVHEATQQKMSKLRPYVNVIAMTGEDYAYDGLGDVEVREIMGRNQPISFDNIEHLRRQMKRKRYSVVLPIDQEDVEGVLLNPNALYANAVASAAQRQYDRVIYDAAFADVKTGRYFDSTVTAANDGVITVDATAGLTYEKLLEIKQNFVDNDVEDDTYLTITGKEHTQLMREEELTSGDFSRQFVVEGGQITKGVGMDFILFGANATKPVIPVASSQRQLIAASKRAIALGISRDMSIKIQERPDIHDTTQVIVEFSIGAVRTEGKLLQKVSVTA